MVETMTRAARTKDEPADLINAAIEELIRRRWELPVFNTLQRAALHVRAAVSRGYYRGITLALSGEAVLQIDRLFQTDAATRQSIWNDLRQDVGYASLSNFRDLVAYFQWLAPEAAKVRSSLCLLSELLTLAGYGIGPSRPIGLIPIYRLMRLPCNLPLMFGY